MLDGLSPAEIFTGTVTVVGGLAMILNKLGFIHLGRKNGCPDKNCQSDVKQTKESIKELKKTVDDTILPGINRAAKGVERIEGFIDGLEKAGFFKHHHGP